MTDFEEAMMIRAGAQGSGRAQAWLRKIYEGDQAGKRMVEGMREPDGTHPNDRGWLDPSKDSG